MTEATEWFCERIRSFAETPAMAFGDRVVAYGELSTSIDRAFDAVQRSGIAPGAVVAFTDDFSPEGVALLFALARSGVVVVPMGTAPVDEIATRLALGEVEWLFRPDVELGTFQIEPTGRRAEHPLLRALAATGHPGLILFSSGSSGPAKAALHDLEPLLEKFRTPRPPMRAAGFLLFDHIGGLNTLWHVLSNGGFFACLPDRSSEAVARTIERHALELLPTSPTFINLLLLSGAIERHDLSSLRVVTYGTEPMPETTLRRVHEALPKVELRQTYGLSELGILRAKSESSESLWVKIGGEGYETRIVDGILHIKARSAMLGYLNAAAPFDAEGWFNTGDLVEVRGDYFRILGRVSDLINVGGQKVHPSEVESVILEMPEVAQAAVSGESNAILGHIVVAHVVPSDAEGAVDAADLRSRVRAYCRTRLAPFKVPAKVVVVATPLHSARFKKKIPQLGRVSMHGQPLSDAIRPATPADLPAMARIHATNGTSGLLSDLGERFLRDVYYRGLLASAVGEARVLEVAGNVVGFVSYSPDSGRLFGQIFRRRIGSTLVALARASLRKPRVAVDFVQSVLTVERSSAGSDIPAEVVSLEIDPAFQGLGLGLILLQRSVEELRGTGASLIKARILEDHRAVERLYLHLGFRRGSPFRLHGRAWVLMVSDAQG